MTMGTNESDGAPNVLAYHLAAATRQWLWKDGECESGE